LFKHNSSKFFFLPNLGADLPGCLDQAARERHSVKQGRLSCSFFSGIYYFTLLVTAKLKLCIVSFTKVTAALNNPGIIRQGIIPGQGTVRITSPSIVSAVQQQQQQQQQLKQAAAAAAAQEASTAAAAASTSQPGSSNSGTTPQPQNPSTD
jgi:hypothetical protein